MMRRSLAAVVGLVVGPIVLTAVQIHGPELASRRLMPAEAPAVYRAHRLQAIDTLLPEGHRGTRFYETLTDADREEVRGLRRSRFAG